MAELTRLQARFPSARKGKSQPVFRAPPILLAVCLLALSVINLPAAAQPDEIHGKFACTDCHSATGHKAGEPPPLRASQEQICGACHRGAIEASHLTGFSPRRALPAGFPTGPSGKMTCSTCHDFHGNSRGLVRDARSGKEFCLACHHAVFFAAMADHGVSITRSGHLNAGTGGIFKADPYSFKCVTCHAGKLATHKDKGHTRRFTNAASHPVGTRYADAMRYGGYRNIETLNDDIILPNGRLSCVSCHRPYTARHGAPPRTQGSICTECHNL